METSIGRQALRVPPGGPLRRARDNLRPRPAAFRSRLKLDWNPMPEDSGLRFLIDRSDLRRTRLATDPDAPGAPGAAPLRAGQVRLAIRRFALTANNVTYAAFGDAMKYWQFFPSGDARWGCLPVWGFAEVCESRAEGVAVGRRVWGYLPAGTHLVVQAERIDARGFVDAAPHRAELSPIYNRLLFCDADPDWRPELEPVQSLLRPLFATSFLIDDFLATQAFFGASQVLLSSASSKTAWGTALCLTLRDAAARPAIVGLTSAANLAYVRSLGVYDRVASYDELSAIDDGHRAVYVDFSGSAAHRRSVHSRWAERLAYSCAVGGTHWNQGGSNKDLPGPRPVLFFAPEQWRTRSTPPPQGLGAAGLQQAMSAAWSELLRHVTAPTAAWLSIDERRGAAALEAGYHALVDGGADPRQGLVVHW